MTESTGSPAETTDEATDDALVSLLTGAVDAARTAVVEFSDGHVGEYLGATCEDPTSATHRFLADLPGYRGWQWAVVVAAYPGADHVTISEVVLVPGPTALLAPEWLPWDQRVKPGDLSPGDLLAPAADDPRLVPGYLLSGDPEVDETAAEIGLGRRQVLSLWGRDDAAQRWHDGEYGPNSAMARSTKRVCRDCGFFLPLAGALGPMFGVCANELAADGHVVDFMYGCGAHSDTPAPAGAGSPLYDPYDDGVLDIAHNPVTAQAVPAQDDTAQDAGQQLAAVVTESEPGLCPTGTPAGGASLPQEDRGAQQPGGQPGDADRTPALEGRHGERQDEQHHPGDRADGDDAPRLE